jgi:hypothetical protein
MPRLAERSKKCLPDIGQESPANMQLAVLRCAQMRWV